MGDYERLLRAIRKRIDQVGTKSLVFDYGFIKDLEASLSAFLKSGYLTLMRLCEVWNTLPDGTDIEAREATEKNKASTYDAIQSLSDVEARLYDVSPMLGLYFLVMQFSDDLKIERRIFLVQGREFSVRPPEKFLQKSLNEIRLLQSLDHERYVEIANALKEERMSFVEMPMSELDNPLSWAFLAHECLHESSVINQLRPKLAAGYPKNVTQDTLDDILIDLCATQYLGPMYLTSLLHMSGKVGALGDLAHAPISIRATFVKGILKRTYELLKSRNSNSSTCDKLAQAALEQALDDAERQMPGLPPTNDDDRQLESYVLKQVDLLQEATIKIFDETGVPTWQDILGQACNDLPMLKDADLSNITERDWVPCCHPAAAFSLIMVAGSHEALEDSRDALLAIFRKWLITRQFPNRVKDLEIL